MKLADYKMMDQCLRQLMTAVSTASLYGAEHQQVLRMCSNAHHSLCGAIGEEPELSLLRVDDQLAVAGQSLPSSLYIDRFARMLKGHGIGHIKFLNGVTLDELHGLVGAIARRDTDVHSSDHLRLGQVEVRHRDFSGQTGRFSSQLSAILDDVSSEELTRIMEVYEAVSQNRKLHVVGLSEIVSGFIDVFASNANPFLALVPLRAMDEYTFTHSLNVCLLNISQAKALGVDGPLLHDIGISAMLHDIGKLLVPEEVLNKAEKLSSEEWEVLKSHPVKGAEYLVKSPGVPRMAVINAYEHHMRHDRRGYPNVSGPWQQSLCSELTAISDVYDALRTHRPYRQPMEVDETLIHISNLAGTQLHPQLTENFIRLMRRVHPAQDSA